MPERQPAMKGDWCTGGKCKARHKAFRAAQIHRRRVRPRASPPMPMTLHDGTACWGIDSMHRQMEYPEHLSDVHLRNDSAKIECRAAFWGQFGKDKDDGGYGTCSCAG